MGYIFLDHTTDAIVEVTASTLEEAFTDAAISAVDITLDRKTVSAVEERRLAVSGQNLDYLLFNWLEEVVYLLITRGFAVRRFSVDISHDATYRIDAIAYGEPIDLKRHQFKVEIKAPTFHDMEIKEGSDIVMTFLLDL